MHERGFRTFRGLCFVRCSVSGKGLDMVITIETVPVGQHIPPPKALETYVKWWDDDPHLEDCISKVIQRYERDLVRRHTIRSDSEGNILSD